MIRSSKLRRFKLAAIDLDGTLLGPDGRISPENAEAVQRLREAGLQVVLASGRHFANMRRYAEALPGVQWIISCQGGELCDVGRTTILASEFLPAACVKETLDLGTLLGFSTVVYAADEIFTDSGWNADLEFYSDLAGRRPVHCAGREFLDREIFKLIWMGNPADIERVLQQGPVNRAEVEMVRTHARLLEFTPAGVSKASALKIIAGRLGVEPAETIAFGDGDNDVPMLEWAGVSVAMAHGWPAALQKATYTTAEGPAATALARGVQLLFERQLLVKPEGARERPATPMAA